MVTLHKHEDTKASALSTKLEKLAVDEFPEADANSSVNCTTPDSKEHRIPDVLTCPPAPRKRKASDSCSKINFSGKKFRKVNKVIFSSELEAMLGQGLHQVPCNKIPWRSKKKFL